MDLVKNKRMAALLVPFTLLIATIYHVRADYMLDDLVGLGRMFDGIGGLSRGGVSQWSPCSSCTLADSYRIYS